MAASNIQITQGTQSSLPVDTIGTVNYPISKIDVGNLGSSVPWQGTVTVANQGTVNTGTINSGTINSGTINSGTINAGTVDAISQLPPNMWGTVINTGTSTLGTLKAGISGSTIYITDLTISTTTVGTLALYNGGTANVLAGTWSFNANGGIVQNYRIPLSASQGSSILYQQQNNNQISICAGGYIK